MKWEGNRESDNVEDVRGDGGGGGGGGGFNLGGGSIGIGSIAIALVASYFFGINPMTVLSLLNGGGGSAPVQSAPAPHAPATDRTTKLVSTVLADTEDTWTQLFAERNATYVKPKLRIFSGSTPTACGTGQTAAGPFYCPDRKSVV